MMFALSPVLLPPPSNTAEGTDEAAKYYYPYYVNTEQNADKYYESYYLNNADFNTEDSADKYYYPYYFNTEKNADIFYNSQLSDPWMSYYGGLPDLPEHVGQYQGPEDILPDLSDGEVDPQENMIFDVP